MRLTSSTIVLAVSACGASFVSAFNARPFGVILPTSTLSSTSKIRFGQPTTPVQSGALPHDFNTKRRMMGMDGGNKVHMVASATSDNARASAPTLPQDNERSFPESNAFLALECAFLATIIVAAALSVDMSVMGSGKFLNLFDAGARSIVALPLLHLLTVPASLALCRLKEIDGGAAVAARTLLFGALELYRVGLLEDKEAIEIRRIRALPPLSMNIDSNTLLSQGISPVGLLFTASMTAKEGNEYKVRRLLECLANDTREKCSGLVSSVVVDQDGEDRRNFLLLQRFPSVDAMRKYQNTLVFKTWSQKTVPLLDGPMGLYLANERNGQIEAPVHPFGPGGEGGRDDSIYSSPTNLQGSATGF